MEKNFTLLFKIIISGLFLLLCKASNAQTGQTLSIKDFAIWGGGAPATNFNKDQGIDLRNTSTITGNLGSNHYINIRNRVLLTGSIYTGNGLRVGVGGQVNGNIFSYKLAPNANDTAILASVQTVFTGDLSSNGLTVIKSVKGDKLSTVNGQISVPYPSNTFYKGPLPTGGINNNLVFPTLPAMPGNTLFDEQTGTQNIVTTRVITPGAYRNIELRGNQTITFDGPGNYIFNEVFNVGKNNNLIFNFKNTTTGNINIFIRHEAQWGNITVRAINGASESRIFTEVHGDGTKRRAQNDGVAFEMGAPGVYPQEDYLWLGNIWAPNGGILIKGTRPSTRPHIIGALWSGTSVVIREVVTLFYSPPPPESVSFIQPYYAPPAQGKETDPNNLIGAELTSLANDPDPIKTIPENLIFKLDEDEEKVLIEVISKIPGDNELKQALIQLGMTGIVENGPHKYIITGYFPISLLTQLNLDPRIEYVRPWYPPINNAGQVLSQGDTTMRSNLVRQRFGLDGSGIKIGVISDSYNARLSAQNDVDQGDLPGFKSTGGSDDNGDNIQVLQDLSQDGKDEGRAMLQIVHDIAPKAKLAFRTGFLSAGDFAKGILELADPNLEGGRCDIIVDDLSYITEPFFRDGVVAKTVDSVVGKGVTYITSAGNFGKRSYGSVFNGVSNPEVIPSPALIHQFGSTPDDIYQSIQLKPGNYTVVLQWDEEFHSLGDEGGVDTDLDLYIIGANNFKLFGFNRSNLFKDPYEVCPFTVDEETIAKLMIVRASGSANVRFKYIIFRGDATILNYTNADSSTIVGHANSNGAISVGAMLYKSFPQISPIWPGVASFSSRGGALVKHPNGNSYITRNKPDLIGPNGGNTTVDLGGSFFNDGDDYPNFFGTSAAAPHAAAVGALIMQGRKKFNQQTTVTPEEIRQQLISSAGRFSYIGNSFSFEGGNGYIQADSALLQIANARPIIDSLKSAIPGSENGLLPFVVVLKGRYITSATQIYVNDVPVATTITGNGTEARAMVAPIPQGEDPAFQLFNPAKSPSGEDGGFSEKKHFFSERRTVLIKPINKRRKYRQDNPGFDVEITINGIPINDPTINLLPEDLKLDLTNLSFNTIATPQSKAGLYGIFVERATPLDLADTLNNKFEFEFQSGTLNVQKMPLRIIADDQTVKYGEYPDEITYTYETNLDGNWDFAPEDFLPEINNIHQEHMSKNGVIVVKGFDDEDNTLTDNDLNNMSTIASFQSVLKAKKYVLENGQLRALVNTIDPDEIGNQRFIIETPLSSLLNYVDNPNSTTLNYVDEDNLVHTGLLNLKSLAKGDASAAMPNGQLKAMVNGQMMGMVNGTIEETVDAGLSATVNGTSVNVTDFVFQNGQLRALVNNEEWVPVTDGLLGAMVNGTYTEFELSVVNGQLRAIVNGEEMPVVNGQLRATVNGQEVSIVNGQLRAMVNGQLVPIVNNDLMGIANGQLRAMVNGEMAALVNGQLMAFIDGAFEEITELTMVNGQLRAMVNGQLRALVNGQLRAMVNGDFTDIDPDQVTLVNGQLRATVNGQLRALVNGQLKALVNGQLRALVNSEAISIEKMIQLPNGQLRALVNGNYIPIRNGQLRAMVNGQLRAMVNGELMAVEEDQLNFTVFENGQLKAMVNGQLKALVNGQLKAMVNGQLELVDDNGYDYSIENGQLKASVNGEDWVFPNGQLKALVNGQLKALVNNFDVSGENNNAKTMVLVGEDDLLQQQGDIGGMFSMAMITGLNAGSQRIIPAAFINENYEVTYEPGYLEILPAPVTVTTVDATKVYGEQNPAFNGWSISGLAYNETFNYEGSDEEPYTEATETSGVGVYPIEFYPYLSENYTRIENFGNLTITPKLLTVKANNIKAFKVDGEVIPELTINYDGLVGGDTEESVCLNFEVPATPKVIDDFDRTITYSNININWSGNIFYATPNQPLQLTGKFESINNPTMDCPGCWTQVHIGMGDGTNNFFTQCYDVTSSGTNWNINQFFNAPSIPGVYYITERATWWYYCGQFESQNHKVDDNARFAIAVVIVNATGTPGENGITASIDPGIDLSYDIGDYPITLTGCDIYNPNYNVVLENGVLSILADPGLTDFGCDNDFHLWQADGDFTDLNTSGNGTAVGGVTATGEGRIGSHSFAFDGSTGYISTAGGTGGSVSGTGNFAVSAWVKTSSNFPMVIINQRDEEINGEYLLKIGGQHNIHYFDSENYGKAYFTMFDPINNPDMIGVFSTSRVNDGNWHHIKGVRIGTAMSIYIDGVLEATINTPNTVELIGNIKTYIGADYRDNSSYFNGLIDHVLVQICQSETGGTTEMPPVVVMNSMVPLAVKEKITSDKLYPNPASNSIRIELTEDVININEIQVLNAFGKVNRANTRKIDDGVYDVNISGLLKGMYFIKARTEKGIKTLKFIKI